MALWELLCYPNSGQLKGWLTGHPTEVTITLGRQAFEDYQTLKAPRPSVSGLLDLSPNLNPTAYRIGLSVDPVLFFETLKKTTPKVRRVFVEPLRAVRRAINKRFAEHLGVEITGALQTYFDLVIPSFNAD